MIPLFSVFFQQSDINNLVPSISPTKVSETWVSTPPTPDGLMYTGTWDLEEEVNILVAIEAYECSEKAKFVFQDRVKSLKAALLRKNSIRQKGGGPLGVMMESKTSDRLTTWLPHEGSTWEGKRARHVQHRNAVITVNASYLHPISEAKLVKLMDFLASFTLTKNCHLLYKNATLTHLSGATRSLRKKVNYITDRFIYEPPGEAEGWFFYD